ncbi:MULTISPECIES: aspartyl-phosphate phosphatase Spo0E family protein [Bacillaceae]
MKKRGELYDLVRTYGLTSQEVLKCSQELDNLLNKLSKI